MEPGRRSPKRRNSSSSLDRSDSNFVRVAVMGSPLCVSIRSEVCHKKRKTAIYHLCVAHPNSGPWWYFKAPQWYFRDRLFPKLISYGDFFLPTYGVLVAAAFL